MSIIIPNPQGYKFIFALLKPPYTGGYFWEFIEYLY